MVVSLDSVSPSICLNDVFEERYIVSAGVAGASVGQDVCPLAILVFDYFAVRLKSLSGS